MPKLSDPTVLKHLLLEDPVIKTSAGVFIQHFGLHIFPANWTEVSDYLQSKTNLVVSFSPLHSILDQILHRASCP